MNLPYSFNYNRKIFNLIDKGLFDNIYQGDIENDEAVCIQKLTFVEAFFKNFLEQNTNNKFDVEFSYIYNRDGFDFTMKWGGFDKYVYVSSFNTRIYSNSYILGFENNQEVKLMLNDSLGVDFIKSLRFFTSIFNKDCNVSKLALVKGFQPNNFNKNSSCCILMVTNRLDDDRATLLLMGKDEVSQNYMQRIELALPHYLERLELGSSIRLSVMSESKKRL